MKATSRAGVHAAGALCFLRALSYLTRGTANALSPALLIVPLVQATLNAIVAAEGGTEAFAAQYRR